MHRADDPPAKTPATTSPEALARPHPDGARRWLEAQGYHVLMREATWSEVLVARGAERFPGVGPDAEGALLDALRRMFPSAAAWELLRRALAVAEVATAGRASATEDHPREEPRAGDAAAEACTSGRANGEAPAPAGSTSSESVEPGDAHARADGDAPAAPGAPPAMPAASAPSAPAIERAPGAPPRGKTAAEPSVGPVAPPAPRTPATAIEELENLRAAVAERRPHLAVMAPRLQRLHLLGWAAEARAIGDAVPRSNAVSNAVARVASLCAKLSKLYWPGSVPALARSARPSECKDELGAQAPPSTWAEVAHQVDECLEELADDPRLDACGWADERWLDPPPPDPEGMLQRAFATCNGLEGALADPPDDIDEPTRLGLQREARESAARAARQLRWLRGHLVDDAACDRWGQAVGHLRRLGGRREQLGRIFKPILDPASMPSESWATQCGYDPDRRRRRRARRTALTTAPAPEQPLSDAELVRWVLASIDAELANPELVPHLAPFAKRLRALDPRQTLQGVDRSVRRRWTKLMRLLADDLPAKPKAPDAGGPGSPTATPSGNGTRGGEDDATPDTAGGAAATRPDRDADGLDDLDVIGEADANAAGDLDASVEVDLDAPELAEPLSGRPARDLIARVEAYARGKRALVIGNREDPEVAERLEEELGLTVTWCVSSPRLVQAQAQRVKNGAYDLVLVATGFQSHKVDRMIAEACRAADVAYVRTNRGRPLAVARAIARDLGLAQPAG